jgi:ABC-type nickel/cobalt efflux system permease component RcnA
MTGSYYLTAFVLGALHSFEPAHGKSVMAAYLIGQRRTVKDAALLALTITITHTFSVFALAVVAWLFAGALAEQQAARALSGVSGALVLTVGLWMLLQRLRHARPHAHGHAHTHHHADETAARGGLGQLLMVGISGGLVPCPGGMAMLLAAIGAGQAAQGVGLVAAFSAGVGAVVLALGVLFCKGSALLERLFGKSRALERWLPLASGVIITGVGLYLIARAWTR